MARTLIGVLGVIAVLLPDRMVHMFEAAAIKNPEECTTKPWLNSAIRAEGAIITGAALTGGKPYQWIMDITGVFGGIILFFPNLYRRIATALVYENPEDVEWNDQFAQWVRVIGILYIILAIRELKDRENK